jgi:cellulose synthase/poly-beta-1,6-N-acetylglucosamine synthase-like glycosyltransferase
MIYLALGALYVTFIAILKLGWRKVLMKTMPDGSIKSFISVVVPVRNEENNLPALVASLQLQTYSSFEVLIVDDHSDESPTPCVANLGDDRFQVIGSKGHGKKAAITTGIEKSRGEIIVTTDADCRFHAQWLHIINIFFNDPALQLGFGAVTIRHEGFFLHHLQALELSSLITTGAALNGLGVASMCNGANLAFRKNVFFEVNGYTGNEHIASGDDEFLLRKVFTRYPAGVRFLNHPGGIVQTLPVNTVREFFHQRIRWAAKWKAHKEVATAALALCVFTFYLSIILLPVFILFDKVDGRLGTIFLVAKILCDAWLLLPASRFLNYRWNTTAFLVTEFLYPVYAVAVGLLSNFIKPEWKKRIVK